MPPIVELDFVDLGLALGLVAIVIALSAQQQLGLAWNLTLATVRAFVQLILIGFALEVVFDWQHPVAVGAILVALLAVAVVFARNRIGRKIPRLLLPVTGAIAAGVALALLYTDFFILRQPATWLDPRYAIPLTGILAASAMNGATLAGERFASAIRTSSDEIETRLCLGATPQQAVSHHRRDAVKAGVLPIINAMAIAGLGTIPNIMAGQLLGGVPPLQAAAYQIVILLMLVLANLVTALLVTSALQRRFFNAAAQLQRF